MLSSDTAVPLQRSMRVCTRGAINKGYKSLQVILPSDPLGSSQSLLPNELEKLSFQSLLGFAPVATWQWVSDEQAGRLSVSFLSCPYLSIAWWISVLPCICPSSHPPTHLFLYSLFLCQLRLAESLLIIWLAVTLHRQGT